MGQVSLFRLHLGCQDQRGDHVGKIGSDKQVAHFVLEPEVPFSDIGQHGQHEHSVDQQQHSKKVLNGSFNIK